MLRTHKARLSFLEVPTDLKPSNIDPVPVYRQGVSSHIDSENIFINLAVSDNK